MIRARRLPIPTKSTFDQPPSSPTNTSEKRLKQVEERWKLPLLLFLTSLGSILIYHVLFVSTMAIRPAPTLPKTTTIDSNAKRVGIESIMREALQKELPKFQKLKGEVYTEFYERYGGPQNAMKLYADTLYVFNNDNLESKTHEKSVEVTARRIVKSLGKSSPFHLSFGGYSITVGRGNYFQQSYPFVLEQIVQPIFHFVGILFSVRNAAIGGTPSFPYGWCLKNFFGVEKSQVVSWDFSMNEGNSAMGLEAYVRHAITNFDNPMIVTLEKDPWTTKDGSGAKARRELLEKYINQGVLGADALILNHDFSHVSHHLFDIHPLPTGLANWTDFGAPPGAPGKGQWHPTYRKHELLGWVLAIYFLQSLDRAMQIFTSDEYYSIHDKITALDNSLLLPPPMTIDHQNIQDPIMSSLFGRPSPINPSQYIMNPVSCYTSFKPILHGNIVDVIKGGKASNTANDLLTEMNQDTYLTSAGWVYDIGKLERDTKQKLIKFDQLGYIDLKTAYYGIPQSGTFKLALPLLVDYNTISKNTNDPTTKPTTFDFSRLNTQRRAAKTFVKSLILCQVNEKRTDKECNMEQNLNIKVGDTSQTNTNSFPPSTLSTITFPGALYLKKPICISVDIPENALISVSRLPKDRDQIAELFVDISVIGDNVSYENGACSISHVILELDLDSI